METVINHFNHPLDHPSRIANIKIISFVTEKKQKSVVKLP